MILTICRGPKHVLARILNWKVGGHNSTSWRNDFDCLPRTKITNSHDASFLLFSSQILSSFLFWSCEDLHFWRVIGLLDIFFVIFTCMTFPIFPCEFSWLLLNSEFTHIGFSWFFRARNGAWRLDCDLPAVCPSTFLHTPNEISTVLKSWVHTISKVLKHNRNLNTFWTP